MKSHGLKRAANWVMWISLILVLGTVAFPFIYPFIRFDPTPEGEGSFAEVDAISKQFRDFYRTGDTGHLPKGHVRLEGMGEEDLDGTWIIYYATASHGLVRGGTIMLLDSTGAMSTFFGHHCSSGDGGMLIVGDSNYSTGYYEGGIQPVRKAFEKAFKLQKTEQIGVAYGGLPSK